MLAKLQYIVRGFLLLQSILGVRQIGISMPSLTVIQRNDT